MYEELLKQLPQYGVFGMWTLSNLGVIWYFMKRNTQAIDNNTSALTELKVMLASRKR